MGGARNLRCGMMACGMMACGAAAGRRRGGWDAPYSVIPDGPHGGPIRNLNGLKKNAERQEIPDLRALRAPRNDVSDQAALPARAVWKDPVGRSRGARHHEMAQP